MSFMRHLKTLPSSKDADRDIHAVLPPCTSPKPVSSSHYKDDRGAVLIILAGICAMIFMLVALGIDTQIISISYIEKDNSAELIASAALQAYLSSDEEERLDKLEDARERAQQIADLQIFLGRHFIKNPDAAEAIGTDQEDDSKTGVIIPGRWHVRPPLELDASGEAWVCNGSSPCPCKDGKWSGPCFEELNLDTSVETPNAFRAEIHVDDSSPLQLLFAGALGEKNYTFSTGSTVAMAPRRIVFLLDLSRAAHQETHIPIERADFRDRNGRSYPSEYAFRLTNEVCPADNSNPCVPPAPTDPYPDEWEEACSAIPVSVGIALGATTCEFAGNYFGSGDFFSRTFGDIYNKFCPLPPNPTEGAPPVFILPNRGICASPPNFNQCPHPNAVADDPHAIHYKTDYRCYSGTYEDCDDLMCETSTAPAVTEHFLIDDFFDPTITPPYLGPEPLNTFLQTIHNTLLELEQNSVEGDMVGFVAFDQSASINIRTVPMIAIDDAQFAELKTITDTRMLDATKLKKRFEEFMLFTRPGASSNTADAVRKAYQMLIDAPNSDYTRSMVMLLTAGVPNCVTNAWGEVDCGWHPTNHVRQALMNTMNQMGFDVLGDGVSTPWFVEPREDEQNYYTGSIRFSVVTAGDTVYPHSRLQRSLVDPNRCMDEDEMKEEQVAIADWQGGDAADGPLHVAYTTTGRYYSFFNILSEATRLTKGFWTPIRPCCTADCSNVTSTINTACSSGEAEIKALSFTDAEGRLTCDPEGRDRMTQANAYLSRMLESLPPYVKILE